MPRYLSSSLSLQKTNPIIHHPERLVSCYIFYDTHTITQTHTHTQTHTPTHRVLDHWRRIKFIFYTFFNVGLLHVRTTGFLLWPIKIQPSSFCAFWFKLMVVHILSLSTLFLSLRLLLSLCMRTDVFWELNFIFHILGGLLFQRFREYYCQSSIQRFWRTFVTRFRKLSVCQMKWWRSDLAASHSSLSLRCLLVIGFLWPCRFFQHPVLFCNEGWSHSPL